MEFLPEPEQFGVNRFARFRPPQFDGYLRDGKQKSNPFVM